MEHDLTIGEVVTRAGVSHSALRFYEDKGLIQPTRAPNGQRRYHREVLRRVAFIRVAQRVGMTLQEIKQALDLLPDEHTPSLADWERIVTAWRTEIDERIRLLQGLRDDLTSCIGCGCLSLKVCRLYNPEDGAAQLGHGPRYLLGNTSAEVTG